MKSIEFEDEKYLLRLTHCLFNHVKWRILVESAAFESPACALQFTQQLWVFFMKIVRISMISRMHYPFTSILSFSFFYPQNNPQSSTAFINPLPSLTLVCKILYFLIIKDKVVHKNHTPPDYKHNQPQSTRRKMLYFSKTTHQYIYCRYIMFTDNIYTEPSQTLVMYAKIVQVYSLKNPFLPGDLITFFKVNNINQSLCFTNQFIL